MGLETYDEIAQGAVGELKRLTIYGDRYIFLSWARWA
jgi:hypothetical protein